MFGVVLLVVFLYIWMLTLVLMNESVPLKVPVPVPVPIAPKPSVQQQRLKEVMERKMDLFLYKSKVRRKWTDEIAREMRRFLGNAWDDVIEDNNWRPETWTKSLSKMHQTALAHILADAKEDSTISLDELRVYRLMQVVDEFLRQPDIKPKGNLVEDPIATALAETDLLKTPPATPVNEMPKRPRKPRKNAQKLTDTADDVAGDNNDDDDDNDKFGKFTRWERTVDQMMRDDEFPGDPAEDILRDMLRGTLPVRPPNNPTMAPSMVQFPPSRVRTNSMYTGRGQYRFRGGRFARGNRQHVQSTPY